MVNIEKKKNFIVSTIYIAIIVALFYYFMKYAFGLFFPFLCAVIVAKFLQRPVNFVCRKTPLKRGIVSVVFVLLSLVVVVSIFVLIILRLFLEVKDFFQYLMIQLEDIPSFIESVEASMRRGFSFLPDSMENSVTDFISTKLSVLLNSPDKPAGESVNFDASMLTAPLLGILNTAKQIPSVIVATVMAIVSCCFMTADYATLRKIILSLFNIETREKIIRSKRLLFPALGKMARAYAVIIGITFCELALGLGLLKLLGIYSGGYILIISLLTAVIDIVPVLGTGTILVPWALYNLFIGNYSMAIGIIVIYVCISIIRQIIEPKLVAAQLGLPAFATIIAMYIGTRIFGFIGLFLLPITLVMIKLLNDDGIIHVFHKDIFEDEAKPAEEKAETPEPEKDATE